MGDSAMTAFLSSISEFATWSVNQIGTWITTITSNAPLTVIVFGMLIVGFAVGLLSRLIRV